VQILGRFCAYLDEGKVASVVEIVIVKASKNLQLQQISLTYGIWFGSQVPDPKVPRTSALRLRSTTVADKV